MTLLEQIEKLINECVGPLDHIRNAARGFNVVISEVENNELEKNILKEIWNETHTAEADADTRHTSMTKTNYQSIADKITDNAVKLDFQTAIDNFDAWVNS
jgi:hypothetical protein